MKGMRWLLFGVLVATCVGCASYGGVTRVGKGKVLVTRNDGFLFGFLRKIYVCDVRADGVHNCQHAEAP